MILDETLSCPDLIRASIRLRIHSEEMDGRVKPGHDRIGKRESHVPDRPV
jgi:hypothetical protein